MTVTLGYVIVSTCRDACVTIVNVQPPSPYIDTYQPLIFIPRFIFTNPLFIIREKPQTFKVQKIQSHKNVYISGKAKEWKNKLS